MDSRKLGLYSTGVSDNFSSVELNKVSRGRPNFLSIDVPLMLPRSLVGEEIATGERRRGFVLFPSQGRILPVITDICRYQE